MSFNIPVFGTDKVHIDLLEIAVPIFDPFFHGHTYRASVIFDMTGTSRNTRRCEVSVVLTHKTSGYIFDVMFVMPDRLGAQQKPVIEAIRNWLAQEVHEVMLQAGYTHDEHYGTSYIRHSEGAHAP